MHGKGSPRMSCSLYGLPCVKRRHILGLLEAIPSDCGTAALLVLVTSCRQP